MRRRIIHQIHALFLQEGIMIRVISMLACFVLLSGASMAQVMDGGTFSAHIQTEGWALNQGSGMRTHIVFVTFNKTFNETPMVLTSLSALDGAPGKDGSVRVKLVADKVTKSGFVIKIQTWGDSRLAGVDGTWIAYGK
jgi:hypothetical protein